MIGNLLIIGIAVSIIWYVKKVFTSDLAGKPFHFVSTLGLIVVLIFSILIPNIDFIKSPFTPKIQGKVIDAETHKPITDAIVILDWGYSYSEFPEHSSGASTKQQIMFTDANGEFKAERRLRCLAINLFLLYNRDNGGAGAIVIKKNYKHVDYNFSKNNNEVIIMHKLVSQSDRRIERSNLLTIKEMAKRRYKQNISKYIENTVDSISRQLYMEGI